MRAPLLQVRGDRVDDLAVEVEAEVVAGREIGEPAVADADHPAVDLVDHGVGHRVGALELGQVFDRSQPLVDPGMGLRRGPWADGDARSHADSIDAEGVGL